MTLFYISFAAFIILIAALSIKLIMINNSMTLKEATLTYFLEITGAGIMTIGVVNFFDLI